MGGLTAFDWPAQAVRFDGNGLALALLALPAKTARPVARQYARRALRQILGELLVQPANAVVLREREQGPVLEDATHRIHISLSYAADRCLIGLSAGPEIGVDIVQIDNLPEIEALSRLYLPGAACRSVIEAPPGECAAGFALAWAQMEARSKCLGLPLAEIDAAREHALQACELVDCAQTGAYRIALATRGLSSEHVITLI